MFSVNNAFLNGVFIIKLVHAAVIKSKSTGSTSKSDLHLPFLATMTNVTTDFPISIICLYLHFLTIPIIHDFKLVLLFLKSSFLF